jgi:CRP-like cAMP-binding protein
MEFIYPNCNNCKARLSSTFSELNLDDTLWLNEIKLSKAYKKGELIFKEGNYPKGLFCVHSGKIKVAQLGDDGKEQIVHLINNGDIMGHRAILGDDQYSCSSMAMEDSQVCFIPKDAFNGMLNNNAKLALKIAHLLADELKALEKKVTHSVQNSVRERVAESILQLKQNYGMRPDNQTINVVVTREDLANLAGTSRETATRYLYEFQNLNVIQLVGKTIKVLDEKKLEYFSHLKH